MERLSLSTSLTSRGGESLQWTEEDKNKDPEIPGPSSKMDKGLHKILWLTCCIASLLTICDVAELSILEYTLHLDDATPLAEKNLRTFTMSVL